MQGYRIGGRVGRVAAGLIAVLLAGCGGGEQPAEHARPVLVTQPGGGAGPETRTFAGEVHAREESPLSFRVGGKLIRRNVDTGAVVKRGEVLAELDPGDLALQAQATQAQWAAAEADLVRARGDLDRYAKLVDQQLISRSSYDAQLAAFKAAEGQARAAQANLDVARNQAEYAQLRAPRDGVIATRQAEPGQVVSAGQTVFTLAADNGREVVVALPESDIRAYRVGQPVQVELWNAPERRLPGSIREISPAADAQTRTYAARIDLPGDAAQVVELGQSARVYLQIDASAGPALNLPLTAIQRGAGERAAVWVVDPKDHRVHLRPVELGQYGEDAVPVRSGVQAGDWVVAAGGHLLREGERVSPVDRQNRPAMPAATAGRAD